MIFEGTWNIVIATPIGKQVVVLEIATRDGKLAGTARQGAEVVELLDPVVDGNRMTWTQHVTRPLRLTLKFDVSVDGATMTGTAKAGILPTSKLRGERVA
jgi:hypothetical protein